MAEKKNEDSVAVVLTAEERRNLADAYDALVGVACEQGEDVFDQFHKRGGTEMLDELEGLVKRLAPAEFERLAV